MTLSQERIEQGKRVLGALDLALPKIDAAFWVKFPDAADWKFALLTPSLHGPLAAYKLIQHVLRQTEVPGFHLEDVSLLKPDAPILKLTRTLMRTGDGIGGASLSNNFVNGQPLPDMYVYRMR
jgi:hypothetical protein